MNNQKVSFITISTLFILILSGCNFPGRSQIAVAITSHQEGETVILNQETRINALAVSSQGIASVELYINGDFSHADIPPEGNPQEFASDQPWTPEEEGNTVISVVAIDTQGKSSEPHSITLQVVPSISESDATPTPTLTVTPEGLPQTQTAQAGCTNSADFIENVTIPPNAFLTAGSNFTKIWRVNNTGSCDWIGYDLVHASGDLLGADSPKALPLVDSGNNADISINMTAPVSPGTYSSTWRIRADDGTNFGPELTLTIIVPEPPTDTPAPTATMTPTLTVTPTPTATPLIIVPVVSVEQVMEQITIPANSTGNTTVDCPAGSIVVSGGFAGTNGLRIYHSMKDDNGWRVYGRNTTTASEPMNVYATCMTISGGSVTQEMVQMNVNANDISHLEVSCPAGSVVTGGGWVVGSTKPVEVYNSSQSGNGWQIYVSNTGSENPLINAYAVCLSGISGTTASASDNGPVAADGTGHVVQACPSGSYATGGGFATNIGVTIYNTSKKDNGWQNYALNGTGTEKGLNTYVICYTP